MTAQELLNYIPFFSLNQEINSLTLRFFANIINNLQRDKNVVIFCFCFSGQINGLVSI